MSEPATPVRLLSPVWPLPRSLATTKGISVDVFSSPYLDVSVQAVPLIYLFDSVYDARPSSCGFLHSEICGSKLAYSSPQLIAVNHVLHRLSMPRHSPCAHIRFTFRFFNWFSSRSLCNFWQLCSFLPDFKFYSVTCLFDVVVLAAFTLQTRSFLIFALHLLFSFQDAFAI